MTKKNISCIHKSHGALNPICVTLLQKAYQNGVFPMIYRYLQHTYQEKKAIKKTEKENEWSLDKDLFKAFCRYLSDTKIVIIHKYSKFSLLLFPTFQYHWQTNMQDPTKKNNWDFNHPQLVNTHLVSRNITNSTIIRDSSKEKQNNVNKNKIEHQLKKNMALLLLIVFGGNYKVRAFHQQLRMSSSHPGYILKQLPIKQIKIRSIPTWIQY